MNHRPADENGDMLPVLSSSDILRGTPAVTQLVRERLELFTGDWWEDPASGNEILEMLQESRQTEADRQALASYLASYIRETPGVTDVRDAESAVAGKQFRFTCTVDTDDGSAKIEYEF